MFCRKCGKNIDDESTFCRFCGTEVVETVQETRIEREYRRNNELLENAKSLMADGSFEDARRILLDLSGFRNADELAEQCVSGAYDYRRRTTYEHAVGIMESENSSYTELIQAAEDLESLGSFENAESLAEQLRNKAEETRESNYHKACELLKNARSAAELLNACDMLEKLGGYKDSEELARSGRKQTDRYERYDFAVRCFGEAANVQQLEDAIKLFQALSDFLDSREYCNESYQKIYNQAYEAASRGTVEDQKYAASVFQSISEYKDSAERERECRAKAREIDLAKKEQAKRDADEAAEHEWQYCKKIINDDKAKRAELEDAEQRLLLIQDHEGAKEALEQCRNRIEIQGRNDKRKIRIGIIIVSTLMILITVAAIFSNAVYPEMRYKNAGELAEQGSYSEAADEYSKLKSYKDSAKLAIIMQANALLEQDKIDEAVSLLYDNDNPTLANEFLEEWFSELVSGGKKEEAIEFAAKYSALEENRVALCSEIIDEMLIQGNYDKAVMFSKQNLPETDAVSRCYYEKANFLFKSKDWRAAAETFGKAGTYLDSEARVKECYLKYADECFAEKKYESAVEYYQKCNNTAKVNQCYIEMGQIDYESGDYRKAMSYFEKAGSAGSSYYTGLQNELYDKAVQLCYSGEYDDAITYFQISGNTDNGLLSCCVAMQDLYNGKSMGETEDKLWDIRSAYGLETQDFVNDLMESDIFTGGSNFKFWNGPTMLCYFATYTWDNGDVKTYCITEYDRQLYVKEIDGYVYDISDLDRIAMAGYHMADVYDIYYDPNKGYYVEDNGGKTYFWLSGSNLVVEGCNQSILSGEYYLHKYVTAHGL